MHIHTVKKLLASPAEPFDACRYNYIHVMHVPPQPDVIGKHFRSSVVSGDCDSNVVCSYFFWSTSISQDPML